MQAQQIERADDGCGGTQCLARRVAGGGDNAGTFSVVTGAQTSASSASGSVGDVGMKRACP